MCPAPRPVVLLLCRVALSEEEVEEEASADAVSVRIASGQLAPLASWAVLQAGFQRDWAASVQMSAVYQAASFRAPEDSGKGRLCPPTVLALQVAMEGSQGGAPTRLGLVADPWFWGLLSRVP